MSENYISPAPSKAVAPASLAGHEMRTLTFTLDSTSTPNLQAVKVIHYRATKEVKVHFNSDLKGPPEKFFQASEGVFAVNSAMRSVHFTADPTNRVTTLYLECE